MKRYKVLKNGVQTNGWTSEFGGPDHYEESFGKRDGWYNQNLCSAEEIASALESRVNESGETEYHIAAQFQIVEEDMDAEIAEEARKAGVRDLRRTRIRELAVKAKDGTITAAERNEALKFLLLDFARDLD